MNKFILLILTVFVFIIFSFSGCSGNDENEGGEIKTIAQIAENNTSFSSLNHALVSSGLTNLLNSPGSYTFFAPTNEAFSSFIEANGFASVDDIPKPLLTQILLNHIILGSIESNQLITGYVNTLSTFDGTTEGNYLSLFINTENALRLNNMSTITMPNIFASNGIIHVVDAIISLPTVATFTTADPTFSILAAALTELTPNTDFATVLSEAGPFTVFAPTNAAFDSLDDELAPSGIAGLDEAALTNVLNYHLASGNVRSSALIPNGNTLIETLLTGNSFTIILPGTAGNFANVTDGAGRPNIGIIGVDIQATNGVIHLVNKVLLP